MHRIVITGPESSGKSALAKALSTAFDAPCVPEYARTYLAAKGTEYELSDIVNIAIGQLALAEALEQQPGTTGRLMIIDTWMLELRVWADYRFGVVPNVLEDMYREHLPDFYVLCKPDIPWEPDPLRENPHDRDHLYDLYLSAIIESGIRYVVASGTGPERVSRIRSVVEGQFG